MHVWLTNQRKVACVEPILWFLQIYVPSSQSLPKPKASSCSSNKDNQLPKQPVKSQIRVYDKPFKDKILIKKEPNIYFQNNKNKEHLYANHSKQQ